MEPVGPADAALAKVGAVGSNPIARSSFQEPGSIRLGSLPLASLRPRRVDPRIETSPATRLARIPASSLAALAVVERNR